MTQLSAKRALSRADVAPRQRPRPTLSAFFSGAWKFVAMAGLTLTLIAGIVAMHSLVSSTSHSDMAMSSTMAMGSSAVDQSTSNGSALSSVDCAGCGVEASTIVMWCVLALLTVSLLLAAPTLIRGWGQRRELRWIPDALFTGWARTAPPRPDLTTLCISRT